MEWKRSRRGFRHVADLSARGMGLPAARARELRLARAWRRVAGEPLARHVRARGIVRGVLLVEADSAAWRTAAESLLPRLASRLASAFPDLGVKRFRLCAPNSAPSEAMRVPDADPHEISICDPPPRHPLERPASRSLTSLDDVASRYLERRSACRDQKP